MCVFFFSFWKEGIGRGDFNHLRCFDAHCLGPPYGDLWSWGGTCACVRGPGSVSAFRVLACERVSGEPRGHVSVGPVYPVFGSQSPPLSLFILPPPHPRAAPQRLASPSHPATGSPLPLSLVLGSSRTLPVSFLSLDSQGGFSSCVSSS